MSKKQYIYPSLMLLLFFFILFTASAQDCNCKENLKFLASKVEANYPGFADKVTINTKNSYQKKYGQLLKNAQGKNGISCFYILNSYVAFFRDQHLNLSVSVPGNDTLQIRNFFRSAPKFKFDSTAFKSRISRNAKGIEGIWELKATSGYYRIAIVKNSSNEFIGVILNADNVYWSPWQVKVKAYRMENASYKIVYFLKDHTIREETTVYNDNDELVMNGSSWRRILPVVKNQLTVTNKQSRDGFSFRQLSGQTAVLRLPDFFLSSKMQIDSVINKNRAAIEKTENLIIDIRNNPGGTVYVYRDLVKYFYTNPIRLQKGLFKASEDNIQHYKNRLNDTASSEAYKKSLVLLIQKLEANKGKLVDADSTEFYTEDSVLLFPKKIGVVVNGNCTSAAELFLLDFQQSSKTVIFGEHTKGVVDYLNGRLNQPLPCPLYTYSYPLLKRKDATLQPVDNIGIKPDVMLKKPETGWIDKVWQYLEQPKK